MIKTCRMVIKLVLIITLGISVISCNKEAEKSSYEKNVEVINNNFDVDIFLYGEDIEFSYGLEYTLINSFDEAVSNADFVYLIINLVEGKKEIDHDDYDLIDEYIFTKEYKVIYLNSSFYNQEVYDYNSKILGELNPMEINNCLLVDGEKKINQNSTYSDISTIIYLIVQNIKTYY